MAIWQCSFHIVPMIKGQAIKTSDLGLLDDEHLWEEKNIVPSFFEGISRVLEKGKSWSEQIDLYGKQGSNRFEVFHENGRVYGASFRIDFTTDYENILKVIIDFCLKGKLKILDSDSKPVTMNFISLKTKIINSRNKDNFDRLNSGKAPNLDFLKDVKLPKNFDENDQ